MAAALWTARTGQPSLSAGTEPAEQIHPLAVEIARAHGIEIAGSTPRPYERVATTPGLVVSVCDRARESDLPFDAPRLHWSIADPIRGSRSAFERAYAQIEGRIERVARSAAA